MRRSFTRSSPPIPIRRETRPPAVGSWATRIGEFRRLSSAAPAEERLPRKKSVFDLNDFDQAVEGQWRWDVLRLTTSLILGGRELGVDGPGVLALSEKLIDSHGASAFEGAGPLPAPAPVMELLTRVATRSKQKLLDDRTLVEGGKRRFVRGSRYRDLPREIVQPVPGALATYLSRLAPTKDRPDNSSRRWTSPFVSRGPGASPREHAAPPSHASSPEWQSPLAQGRARALMSDDCWQRTLVMSSFRQGFGRALLVTGIGIASRARRAFLGGFSPGTLDSTTSQANLEAHPSHLGAVAAV